ncbi:MAG: outer membrane beta-barrel protein [Cyclobacteriaceae bacterium]|nr:outer membrane beta-barrel protein [Cyclobacteriaceae bacterium]
MKTQYFPIAVFFFLFMITSPRAVAQEGEVYVSLAGGVSVPLSDYANTDFNDESSGFAMIGGNFAINFGYKLNEYLSLSGLLSGSVNRYNYIKLQDWFTENYKESLPDTRWLIESKNWGLGGLMIGVTGSIPLKPNKIFLDGRVLGGFTYAYSPSLNVTGLEDGADDLSLRIDQYSSISWALDFGAGFRYQRTRKQYFTLYADYLMAHPYYNNIDIIDNDIGVIRSDSFSQRVNAVNITLGIGYIVN